CRRSVCRKAEIPSMINRMHSVNAANTANMKKTPINPVQLLLLKEACNTILQSTSDNS
ncbi:hypothetical protein NDU88_006643, partial [Pleurodeles waltl]